MTIEMLAVESSQIESIGHDVETNTLAIRFKSKKGVGSLYFYENVGPILFADFLHAESIGKFFAEHLKYSEDHPYVKVQGPKAQAQPTNKVDDGEALLDAVDAGILKILWPKEKS